MCHIPMLDHRQAGLVPVHQQLVLVADSDDHQQPTGSTSTCYHIADGSDIPDSYERHTYTLQAQPVTGSIGQPSLPGVKDD